MIVDDAVSEAADSALLAELKWVHSMVRRDLQTCRELAASISAGASAPAIRAEIEALQTRGPLFQLRVSCLRYCAFVHAHHGAEDAMLFPAVRQSAPELAAVVDRLESDHRVVSDLLDEVEAAGYALEDPADDAARRRLVDALTELSVHLLEHLAFEETALAPVLNAWPRWPFYG